MMNSNINSHSGNNRNASNNGNKSNKNCINHKSSIQSLIIRVVTVVVMIVNKQYYD